MTVKEIFEMRKQGRIEEAYDAIRPMYAAHKGFHTTLCMFWTANDVLKKRIGEKRLSEAERILMALLRVLPRLTDEEGTAHMAFLRSSLLLAKAYGFDVLEVVSKMEVEKLPEDAWEDYEDKNHRPMPSPALQLLTLAFLHLKREPTVGRALQMMPLLQLAVSRYPEGEDVRRYSAFVYMIMGEPTKAISLYNKILQHRHEPRLYAELADIIDDPCYKAGLLCKAIEHESREAYRTGYRLDLAQLLLGKEDGHAAYELQRCIANRQSQGSPLSSQMLAMQARLQGVSPATEAEQQAFYRKVTSQNHIV